jgi:hypothetical protein
MSVTGKVRREVVLPSQEEKKGVMQYALSVLLALVKLCKWLMFIPEQLSIK